MMDLLELNCEDKGLISLLGESWRSTLVVTRPGGEMKLMGVREELGREMKVAWVGIEGVKMLERRVSSESRQGWEMEEVEKDMMRRGRMREAWFEGELRK